MVSSNGKLRKHPWVTYALGLLMLSSFGYLALPETPGREAADEAVVAAIAFFEANPDVEVDPRFAAIVGLERVKRIRQEEAARRDANGVPGLRGYLPSRTQKKYRRLEQTAVASVEELPTRRFGVVNRESPGSNYLAHVFLHETTAALAVSLAFFLLVGLALETAWGSLLFAGVCAAGTAATAAAYVVFYGETGSPWIGASGLVATLVGAYFVRAFRGFVIPGWLVLPTWAALEYLVARGLWIESFESAPVNAHLVGLGLGATGALAVWLFGIEKSLGDRRSRAPDLVANPIVDRALQARQDGKPDEALALLQKEVARSPGNRDAAVAFWDVAVGMGRAEMAESAMLAVVRDSLRLGQSDEAARHWLTLMGSLPALEVEARLAVRLGEVLLDEGHPDEAVRVLRSVVRPSKPELSSALASRAVRVARDLDPDLTRLAAEVALGDSHLDPAERTHLQFILDEFAADSRLEAKGGEGDQTDTMPAAPEPRRAPVSEPDPLQDPNSISPDALADTPPLEADARELDDYQDPHALPAAALEEDPSQPSDAPATSQAEMERWNSPGLLEDLSGEMTDERDGGDMDPDVLDRERLACEDEDTEAKFIMPVQCARGSGDPSELDLQSAAARPEGRGLKIDDDTEVELCSPGRTLRVRSAVPMALEEAGIAFDMAGTGKTVVPYDRIDALSVAAVKGLSQKVVIVIDAVLNWVSPPDEPLKVIRLRSDEFNPRTLAPNADSATEALRAVLLEILRRSGAEPLPNAEAASGRPFSIYTDLSAYQCAALGVDGDSTSGQ